MGRVTNFICVSLFRQTGSSLESGLGPSNSELDAPAESDDYGVTLAGVKEGCCEHT